MRTTVIGLGLIGGSIARDLRKSGFATELIGVENQRSQRQKSIGNWTGR